MFEVFGIETQKKELRIPTMNSGSIQSENFLDRESSLGVVLMLPGLILLAVFLAYPFFLGIWLSLTDTRIGMPGEFIGLWNYVDLLEVLTLVLIVEFPIGMEALK